MNFSENAVADKFYTIPEVAKECIDTLNLDDYDLIIEPSAGSWAFSRWLPRDKTISLDLYPDPEWSETIQQDYLELDLMGLITSRDAHNVLIIGNPPYGRLSSLAVKFVKKSCISIENILFNVKTTVAFIVSETFAKNSYRIRIPTTHTMTQHVHLGAPFTVDGEPYTTLNCGWFVWEPIAREKETILRQSEYLTFHTKEEFLALQTRDKCAIGGQGAKAGKVYWDRFEDHNPSTTRFCSGPGVHVLEEIDWTPYVSLTICAPSLATGEIFLEVEKIMAKKIPVGG